ncbi:hypothetical protein AAHC03_012933 [Spirometra sp. Aus1]
MIKVGTATDAAQHSPPSGATYKHYARAAFSSRHRNTIVSGRGSEVGAAPATLTATWAHFSLPPLVTVVYLEGGDPR